MNAQGHKYITINTASKSSAVTTAEDIATLMITILMITIDKMSFILIMSCKDICVEIGLNKQNLSE